MPTPMATQAHTFIPVNGSVPRALAEVPVPLALAEPVEPLVRVDEDWESEELPVEDEEPAPLLEVEPELEPEPELEDEEDPLGCELVLLPVSGSTYCWSPAEVLVPWARTAAAPPSEPAATAVRQARMRMNRRTKPY